MYYHGRAGSFNGGVVDRRNLIQQRGRKTNRAGCAIEHCRPFSYGGVMILMLTVVSGGLVSAGLPSLSRRFSVGLSFGCLHPS